MLTNVDIDILSKDFLMIELNITNYAYLHHECFDGSGYPLGLKGDAIPLAAQIIQISDAFDAMTTKRTYRDARSVPEALNILKEQSGKQFNPKLVDVALRCFRNLHI